MAQPDIIEVFEDCVSRINRGETIEDCLQLYPQYALRLRPMLDSVESVRIARLSPAELLEDQLIVWQAIEDRMSKKVIIYPTRRFNIRYQLLIAILMFVLLTLGTWVFLSRPTVDNRTEEIVPIIESLTPFPTLTSTLVPSPTVIIGTIEPQATTTLEVVVSATIMSTATPTLTPQPTLTYTLTATHTYTPTFTPTYTSTPTPLSSESNADGEHSNSECPVPLTLTDVIDRVLEIYPNTTILNAKQLTLNGGRLVWEVTTSHDITVTVDVACGYVLKINRNSPTATPTITDNPQQQIGSPSTDNGANGENVTSENNLGDGDEENGADEEDEDWDDEDDEDWDDEEDEDWDDEDDEDWDDEEDEEE
jgi:hypothetical protein